MDDAQLRKLAEAYLQHLAGTDLAALLALFSENAIVHSPLYGMQPANKFYTDLFGDTESSRLTHLQTFTDADSGKQAIHFQYHWTLADGRQVEFELVDVIRLDPTGKIAELRIIYDTAATRADWQGLKEG